LEADAKVLDVSCGIAKWNAKIKRCGDGDQVWGYFKAKKSFA